MRPDHPLINFNTRGGEKYIMFTSLNPHAIGFEVPFTEALELARRSGFAGLDVPVVELSGQSAQQAKEQYAEAQLRPGGWGLPIDFRHDEATYQAGLTKLSTYAKVAQELGSNRCFTWILPFSDEFDFQTNMDLHVKRLRGAAQILADYGCKLGLEFVGPATARQGHRYTFISTMAEALEMGQQINTGNTGLLLDCWHWYTAHGTLEDLKRLIAEQVVYVHVNDAPAERSVDEQIDNQRLLPGASGVIDIANFLNILNDIGYDGPVVVEPFNAELNALPYPERVQTAYASLQKIWRHAGLRI
jgi:sugar phosphate isomerase/epimerase